MKPGTNLELKCSCFCKTGITDSRQKEASALFNEEGFFLSVAI